MLLRKATLEDSKYLSEWLHNEKDCLYALNQVAFKAEDLERWLHTVDQLCFILEDKNIPIAYGEIWRDDEEKDLEFAHLIVNNKQRNKGYGKLLIKALENEAKMIPYPYIYMRVLPDNKKAIQCYQTAAFVEEEGLRKLFDGKWVWFKKKNHS